MDYQEFLDTVDRTAYHEGEWRWQEGESPSRARTIGRRRAATTAAACCSYADKDGKLVKIEGDPLATFNDGTAVHALPDMVEAVNHPDRLKYPLRARRRAWREQVGAHQLGRGLDDIVEHVRR